MKVKFQALAKRLVDFLLLMPDRLDNWLRFYGKRILLVLFSVTLLAYLFNESKDTIKTLVKEAFNLHINIPPTYELGLFLLLVGMVWVIFRPRSSKKPAVSIPPTNPVQVAASKAVYKDIKRQNLPSNYSSIDTKYPRTTYSLTGNWQAGKTTTVGLILKSLEKEEDVDYLYHDTLTFGNVNESICSLMLELSKSLKSQYFRSVGFELTPANDYKVDFGPVSFSRKQHLNERDIKSAFNLLLSRKRKMIIVIDDIDRLSYPEQIAWFRVIEFLAKFAGLIYVAVPINMDEVEKTFQLNQGPGISYLNKILPIPQRYPAGVTYKHAQELLVEKLRDRKVEDSVIRVTQAKYAIFCALRALTHVVDSYEEHGSHELFRREAGSSELSQTLAAMVSLLNRLRMWNGSQRQKNDPDLFKIGNLSRPQKGQLLGTKDGKYYESPIDRVPLFNFVYTIVERYKAESVKLTALASLVKYDIFANVDIKLFQLKTGKVVGFWGGRIGEDNVEKDLQEVRLLEDIIYPELVNLSFEDEFFIKHLDFSTVAGEIDIISSVLGENYQEVPRVDSVLYSLLVKEISKKLNSSY